MGQPEAARQGGDVIIVIVVVDCAGGGAEATVAERRDATVRCRLAGGRQSHTIVTMPTGEQLERRR